MKLGSLFDGSGGFPLSGIMCGIKPIWASEVEPYPIAVTTNRFPNMKHLGDISKINGAEIEPVDVITFGSPCQDLSVAGKRAGLKHENHGADETTRSGLFMEAVRIIKEMREKTNGQYPRFAVWENVPGAFSSNKGEDFRVVLEEIIKIVEKKAVMPEVPPFGWAYADSYCGDGWSLAYRVLDAQYWGVPQRRRRIYLVADFGGQCARKILFEREGLRGCFKEGERAWKSSTANVKKCVRTNDRKRVFCLEPGAAKRLGGYVWEDLAPTLRTEVGDNRPSVAYSIENHPHDCRVKIDESGKVQSLTGRMGTGGGNVPMVMEKTVVLEGNGQRPSHRGDGYSVSNKSYTLNTTEVHGVAYGVTTKGNGDAFISKERHTALCAGGGQAGQGYPCTVYAVDQGGGKSQANVSEDMSPTLTCTHGGAPAIAVDQELLNRGQDEGIYQEKIGALYAGDSKVGSQYVGQNKLIVEPYEDNNRYIVRRLMPVECARLQGFRDRWGNIAPKTDFSDEEYAFWLDVRNTHAEINGRKTKEYTKAQMLTWYNKLHTDSAEYKLWGNGIALPTALYVMQGIKEVQNESY